jgi:DNA repair protein RadA/Sms
LGGGLGAGVAGVVGRIAGDRQINAHAAGGGPVGGAGFSGSLCFGGRITGTGAGAIGADGRGNPSLLFASETDLEKILEAVRETKPRALVVDSVQTVHKAALSGGPGSVAQIRECAAELLHLAKGEGLGVFLLGHVTKEGDLAGPRVLEHMVDTVSVF